MANSAPVQSYETPDSNPWGMGGLPEGNLIYGDPAVTANGFYDSRDDMVGGTDSQWNEGSDHVSGAKWASYGDSAPTTDAANWSTGGTLSQSDLAS